MPCNHAVLLPHTCANKTELAAAVRGLIQVHKVHIHGVPWDLSIELSVELEQGFLKATQTVDPHFGRRERV